mmetsp:Transcript_167473/g.407106  ORF Transcript_167473/g.407106 Transcript_167473/m.407106 type:complete len:317 (-) Transcript_167473:239-1189(-)
MCQHPPAHGLFEGRVKFVGPLPWPGPHGALFRHAEFSDPCAGHFHLLDAAPRDVHLRGERGPGPASPQAPGGEPCASGGDDAGVLPDLHARLSLCVGPRPRLADNLLPVLRHSAHHAATHGSLGAQRSGAAGHLQRRAVLLHLHAQHLHRRHRNRLCRGAGAGAPDIPAPPGMLLPQLPPARARPSDPALWQAVRKHCHHSGPGLVCVHAGPRPARAPRGAEDENDILFLPAGHAVGLLPDARPAVVPHARPQALPVDHQLGRRAARRGLLPLRRRAARHRLLLPRLRHPPAQRQRRLRGPRLSCGQEPYAEFHEG